VRLRFREGGEVRLGVIRFLPDFHGYRAAAPRLQRPLSVNVAATHRCVCDCLYCYAERQRTPEVGLDRLRALFDELAANEILLVDVAGGDLFARGDALSILEEMARRDRYGRSHNRHRDELFLRPEQKERVRHAIRRLRESHPGIAIDYADRTDAGVPVRKSPSEWQRRALCSGGRVSMLIQPNGDVTLCDQIPHAEPFVVGNAFREGVLGVWRSARLEAFLSPDRQRFAGTVCASCSDFDACHREAGYCYRDALFHYGSAFDAPPDCPRQTRTPLRAV
jgi:radical SAM protein with 4Fe4S-binding SPASM domain